MSVTSLVRKTYDGVALVAVLNVVFVGGLLGYLYSSGAVDGEKLRKFVAVIRGAELATEEAAEEETRTTEEAPPRTNTPLFTPATAQMDMEAYRREADRIQEELRQRLALNNSILLRISTERKNFRLERAAAAKAAETEQKERRMEGFEKQIAILEGVKPATAIEYLLSLGDADESAVILMAMDDRKAKRIVEAAKKPAQRKQMSLILQNMKNVSLSSGDSR